MHPLLIELGWFKLHTYGALMGAAFLSGLKLLGMRAKALEIDDMPVQNILFLCFLGGLIGARTLFIFVDGPLDYLRHPLEIFKIWNGGLVFFGGFLTALTAIIVYAHRHRLGIWRVLDLTVIPLVLGHAL